ncbi:hypothetical protein K503DRAFT_825028 [Rhizopogon vinicolor AM-OR11-026]|uniref:Uncharacterized protein n=1 Tax=Rhizopogon vinicolor AM-OR11-026 TaxID=1314800 RepID=A0A1B7ND23_9AGAM|nr:hypothetical protein K503DRAFT_825028 [Rhizopogon vinicolor AM-OR11-026]
MHRLNIFPSHHGHSGWVGLIFCWLAVLTLTPVAVSEYNLFPRLQKIHVLMWLKTLVTTSNYEIQMGSAHTVHPCTTRLWLRNNGQYINILPTARDCLRLM